MTERFFAVDGYSEDVATRILRFAGAPLRMTLGAVDGVSEDVAVKILRCAQDDYASAKERLLMECATRLMPSNATLRD